MNIDSGIIYICFTAIIAGQTWLIKEVINLKIVVAKLSNE